MHAALVGFAELGAFRLKHLIDSRSSALALDLLLCQFFVLRHRVMIKDFTLEDSNLNAARSVSGVGGNFSVVDIRTQRMKRDPTFAIPFGPGNFGTAKATAAIDTNALRAKPHC